MNNHHKTLALATLIGISIDGSLQAITKITKENCRDIVAQSKDKILVIDFWADWCNPCKQMAPVFEAFDAKMKRKYICAKADVMELQEFAQEFQVQSLPTFAVIKNGKILGKIIGSQSQEQFDAKIKEIVEGIDLAKLSLQQLQQRMLEAIMACNFEEIQKISSLKQFDINAPFADGNNPLSYAAIFGQQMGQKGVELVQALLNAGADPEFKLTMGGGSFTVMEFMAQVHENTKRMIEFQQTIVTTMQVHPKKMKRAQA